MILFKTAAKLGIFLSERKNAGQKIGFIPTMGALHEGHISLISQSIRENDITVCSIFVNPTQFNNPADFEKYPVTMEADIDKLEKNGCDVLFLPSFAEIYPPGFETPHYNLGYLETLLEGKYRPGHFQGVCQVVDRLLTIVDPHILYLGQKDFQQCMVIKHLIKLKSFNTKVHIGVTIRETDGLAMSSRNTRLNEAERKQALKIFETLSLIKNEMKAGSLEKIKDDATKFLSLNGFRVDYVEICEADNLKPLPDWNGTTPAVILIAAFINEIRLIDNLLV